MITYINEKHIYKVQDDPEINYTICYKDGSCEEVKELSKEDDVIYHLNELERHLLVTQDIANAHSTPIKYNVNVFKELVKACGLNC